MVVEVNIAMYVAQVIQIPLFMSMKKSMKDNQANFLLNPKLRLSHD